MPDSPAERRRPGTRIVAWGLAAMVTGILLFVVSAIIGLVQGHTFNHSVLLAIPLVLVMGGLSAVTAGSVQRMVS